MTGWHNARLGDVCRQERIAIGPGERPELPYLGMETVEPNTGRFLDGELSKTPQVPQANSFLFGPGHVLYGKLRPYLNKVALPDFEGKCSTELIPLMPRPELDRRYLAYFLRSATTVSRISAKAAGARMPRADMDFVFALEIPLPPLDEQRRMVDLLSRAEGIVRLRREAQKKAAEIIPALFLDMFGDPATNPKGWPVARLEDIARVVSGLTKGRKLNGKAAALVPYLRVANVQAGFIDLTEIKEIEATLAEIEDLKLQAGDIVLTEGGDYDKLGRGAQWRGEIDPCIHQNHVFRVRLNPKAAASNYFEAYLQTAAAARYFLSVAKRTTNLASINMTQLRSLPVTLPPIEPQLAFVELSEQIRSIQRQGQSATLAAQATFNALLAKVFSLGGNSMAQQRHKAVAVA